MLVRRPWTLWLFVSLYLKPDLTCHLCRVITVFSDTSDVIYMSNAWKPDKVSDISDSSKLLLSYDAKGSGTPLVRLYKDNAFILGHSPQSAHLTKLALLIQTLPSHYNWIQKEVGCLNTLKFAQTLPLKSTTFLSLNVIWVDSYRCFFFSIRTTPPPDD